MPLSLRLTVEMRPVGKARPRVTEHGTYTPAATVAAENTIRMAWLDEWGWVAYREWGDDPALRLTVTVYLERKKTVKRPLPTVAPDEDNYLKLVQDALNGIAYRDDRQITDGRCIKRYALPGEPERIEILLEPDELTAAEALTLGLISPTRVTRNRK